jgi:Arc/MetJ family transcription regulator
VDCPSPSLDRLASVTLPAFFLDSRFAQGALVGHVRPTTQRQLVASANLQDMYQLYILIHMKTTLNIDDALLERARRLSNIQEKTAVVHAGLEALIARESARRLARLGGSEPKLEPVRRRRARASRSR